MQELTLSPVLTAGFPSGLMRLDYSSSADDVSDNALLLPPAPGNRDWIVCLHGFNGKSNQIFVRSDIKQHWLPEYLKYGYGIFSPNLRGDSWMNASAEADMQELLNYLRQNYNAGNFIFSSGSMGATASLIYACHHPEDVYGLDLHGAVCEMSRYYEFCAGSALPLLQQIAASLERAYGGAPNTVPGVYRDNSALYYTDILKEIPLFQIHGTADELMPVAQARWMAGAMAEAPLYAYVEVPGGTHNTPLAMEQEIVHGAIQPLEWITHKNR